MSLQSRWKPRFIASLFLLLVPLLAVKLDQPFVIIFFLLSGVFLVFAVSATRRWRIPFLACLIITSALGFADIYLNEPPGDCQETKTYQYQGKAGLIAETGEGYLIPDNVLGYRARANTKALSIKECSKKSVFRANYTFDESGNRKSKGSAQPVNSAGLLFGDSFALGQGVQDEETFGSFLEKQSGYKYHVHNLGLFGYGPHQTFAILQNQLEKNVLKNTRPEFAIYFSVFDPSRSAGHASWVKSGPHYEIDWNDELHYVGPFEKDWKFQLIRVLNKSPVLRNTILPGIYHKQDTRLFIRLILESSRLYKSRYGTKFIVFLWPMHHPDYKSAVQRLKAAGVTVITPTDIFANYEQRWQEYLIPQDGHPNVAAYREAAQYFVDHVLR